MSNPREGYFRIEHSGTGSVVDLYDVEGLYFGDGSFKQLTEGRVIGAQDWLGEVRGTEVDYERDNVSFEVSGNTVSVLAAVTVTTQQEVYETYQYAEYLVPGAAYGLRLDFNQYPNWDNVWGPGNWRYVEEQVSVGYETIEQALDEVVIWEGSRTEVDSFQFANGQTVNVINVSDTDLADNPVFDTIGTEGIDLIFGSEKADLIDGKGGDDIIFGGGGDDVIIGGSGDDVIAGGDGADTLRGDNISSDDTAATLWAAAATEFNTANASNQIVFDDDNLSLSQDTTQANTSADGNDVIIGGDGIDDIESGDGKNFVASGKADLDGDGAADLDLINNHIEGHNNLFDDDEWI